MPDRLALLLCLCRLPAERQHRKGILSGIGQRRLKEILQRAGVCSQQFIQIAVGINRQNLTFVVLCIAHKQQCISTPSGELLNVLYCSIVTDGQVMIYLLICYLVLP